jgi:hypothetical protein
MKVSFIRNGNLRRKVGDNALGVEGYPVPLLCNIIALTGPQVLIIMKSKL